MSLRRRLTKHIVSKLVAIRNRFFTLNGLKRIEKECVKSHVITSSSFKDYLLKNQFEYKRTIYSWLYVCYLILMVMILALVVYKDEPDLYLYFGLPFADINGHQELLTVLLLCYVFAAFSRASILITKAKHQLEIIEIFHFLESPLRGKLMRRQFKKLCILVEIMGNHLIIFAPLGETIIAFFYFIMAVNTFCLEYFTAGTSNIPLANIALRLIIGWLAFTYALHLVSRLTFISLSVLTVFYLRIRFEQVKTRILNSRSPRMLLSAIHEHNEIFLILISNNQLMKYLVFFFYFIETMIFDLLLYLAVLSPDLNAFIHLIPLSFSLGSGVGLALQAYVSGNMSKYAHLPYARLNSIIVKRRFLDRKIKFHVINLLERLADTKIAVWFLDLFQLDYFNFYMLVTLVAQNLLFIINLKTNFMKGNQI